jgi:hypothetical protein
VSLVATTDALLAKRAAESFGIELYTGPEWCPECAFRRSGNLGRRPLTALLSSLLVPAIIGMLSKGEGFYFAAVCTSPE